MEIAMAVAGCERPRKLSGLFRRSLEKVQGFVEDGILGRERTRPGGSFLGSGGAAGVVVADVGVVFGSGAHNLRRSHAILENGLAGGVVIIGDGQKQGGAIVQSNQLLL